MATTAVTQSLCWTTVPFGAYHCVPAGHWTGLSSYAGCESSVAEHRLCMIVTDSQWKNTFCELDGQH